MKIWTDGSCQPNPGSGGWAFYCDELNYIVTGGEQFTTNNKMELTAILRWQIQIIVLWSFQGELNIMENNEILEANLANAKRKLVDSSVGNNQVEQQYGKAFQALVAAGLRTQLKKKYR